MKITSIAVTALTLSFVISVAAKAAEQAPKSVQVESKISSDDATSMSSGEIKKIDKDAGKITIKHGPLSNLEMPAMTMVFRVKDSSMLEQVKVGDKIKCIASKMNGALTVTSLQTDR